MFFLKKSVISLKDPEIFRHKFSEYLKSIGLGYVIRNNDSFRISLHLKNRYYYITIDGFYPTKDTLVIKPTLAGFQLVRTLALGMVVFYMPIFRFFSNGTIKGDINVEAGIWIFLVITLYLEIFVYPKKLIVPLLNEIIKIDSSVK